MNRDKRLGLSSILSAMGANKDLLKKSPDRLREVAHHHFVGDGLPSEVVEHFFESVGLPPLQLAHPVVLLGREERALKIGVGPVHRMVFSPCGQTLAVGAAGGKLILVDREKGEERVFEAHEGLLTALAFSLDGQTLFTAGKDRVVRAWSLPEVSLCEELNGHKKQVNSLKVSPDGAWLASASDDGSVRLWSMTGGEDRRLVGHTNWVTDLAWLDNKRLVSASADSILSIWSAEGHGMVPLYGHVHPIQCVTSCPEVGLIASGDRSGLIRIWDADSGETVETLSGHGDAVMDLAFDEAGHFLMSASGDRSLVLWDTVSRAVLGRFPGHARKVVSVAWSPEGRPTSLAADRVVREWKMASIRPGSRQMAHQAGVRACALTPSGRILSASRDYSMAMWSAEDLVRYGSLCGHEGSVESICVLPPGDRALSASTDGRMILWDLDTQRPIRTIECEQGPLSGCAVAHSGRLHVSAGRDATTKIWDGDTGELWFTLKGHTERVRTCLVHPDGLRLITGSYDHTLRVWEARTGRCLGVLDLHQGPIIDCTLSADGQDLVAASLDGTLSFWDLESGGLLAHVKAHEGGVVALSDLGEKHVVSAGMDGFLRVWETEKAICLHHHPVPGGASALASHDDRLVCGDKHGNLWVFNWREECLRPEDWPKGNPRLLEIA